MSRTRLLDKVLKLKTILYLDHTAKMGGGEIALLNLIRVLDRNNYYPIVVLASDGTLAKKLKEDGVETHVIQMSSNIVEARKDSLGIFTILNFGKLISLFKYVLVIARWAKRRKVDLIHTNSLKSDIYGGLAGRLAGIPVLWHVRDNISSDYLPAKVAKVFRLLAKIIPNAIIANSFSTLKTLGFSQTNPDDIKSNKIKKFTDVVYSCHIPQGDIPDAPQCISDGIDANHSPIIALIGRITPWKGQDVFIRAASKVVQSYPSTKFWIVGSPLFGETDFEKEIQQLVVDLGLSGNVSFLGFRDDVHEHVRNANIVAHASTVGEPFGQVVIEGMSAGKPVIATDGGALPEIVIPGETGLLVTMGDHDAMADAMLKLLADPKLCTSMGLAGLARVKDNFTLEHTGEKIRQIYNIILNDSDNSAIKINKNGTSKGYEIGREASIV